jgi:hypothetical protein
MSKSGLSSFAASSWMMIVAIGLSPELLSRAFCSRHNEYMAELSPATLLDGSTFQRLRVRVDRAIRGVHLARSVLESGRLTTVHERVEEERLHRTLGGRMILTRDNPLLEASARVNLDAEGLIRPGVVIDEQTILASVLRTIEAGIGGPPPAPGMIRAEDNSLQTPFGWRGAVVVGARFESQSPSGVEPPKNQVGQIAVQLRLVLPISLGDVLLLKQRPIVIAGVIESTEADILVDASVGRLLELSHGETAELAVSVASQPARWAMDARSTGPYSLITLRPLGHQAGFAGQYVTPAHAHSLAASGMLANLAELATLKSDDVAGRVQLNVALRSEGEFPAPGTPETFRVLLTEFMALGLKPSVHASADHCELSLAPMTDFDRFACSSASITKSDTVHFRTLTPVAGGIMCEQIFGPDDPERRFRFGHIQLPDPIVPWVFRMPMPDGERSVLSRALGIGDNEIAALIDHELSLDENGGLVDNSAPRPGQLTGSPAIERLLQALPDESLPAWLSVSADARTALIARTVLVLPPEIRPMILLQSGNFATSDLNEHYRRVINRVNRLRKLKELNAPETILRNETRILQRTADCLFANTFLPEDQQIRDDDHRPLKDLLDVALDRLRSHEAKSTDYSAIARAVSLSSTQRDTAVLPESVAKTLNFSQGLPVLVTRPPRPGEFSAPIIPLRTAIHGHAVIGLHPDSYDALFPGPIGVNECIVHRPVTPPAVEEALARIGRVQAAAKPPRKSWMDQADLRLLLGTLLDSTINATRLSFDSPAGILLAGAGSAKFSTTDPPHPTFRHSIRKPEKWWTEIPDSWGDAQ